MTSGPVTNLEILEVVWKMKVAKDKAVLWDELPGKRCRGKFSIWP
jgi:hypothetical protein